MDGFHTPREVLSNERVQMLMRIYSEKVREFVQLKERRMWLDSPRCNEDNSRRAKTQLTRELKKREQHLMSLRSELSVIWGFKEADFFRLSIDLP